MIFGMPTLIELDSLDETAKLCSELGLDFVELNMNLPQYQTEKLIDADYFKAIAEKYNIYYTIHLDENLNVCDFNNKVSMAYIDTVRETINIAKMLNVPILNMHMNPGVHFTLPDRKVRLFEKYNDFYMGSLKNFRRMCEEEIGDSNIKISIENTDGFKKYEQEGILYLLESDVFTLTWDIGHLNSCGNADLDFILDNENQLEHFHIHDSIGPKNHMTLGTGELDLNGRLAVAERNGCRCVIETKTVDALKDSVCWLRENNFIK